MELTEASDVMEGGVKFLLDGGINPTWKGVEEGAKRRMLQLYMLNNVNLLMQAKGFLIHADTRDLGTLDS